MGQRVQATKGARAKGHRTKPSHHPPTWRRAPGRKAGPAPDEQDYGERLLEVEQHCFPDLNRWLDALPDPRVQERCTYSSRHIWRQMLMTFLLRSGSRNALDADRNSGLLPENIPLRNCSSTAYCAASRRHAEK